MTREEAIRRIKAWNLDSDDIEVLSIVIPELAESEDERIRKMLVEQMERWKKCAEDSNVEEDVKDASAAIAYLEKQKEQKPVHTAKEVWKEMRLQVYAQASGNRHEPNYSDDSTKMFSLCDIDEIFEKIGNSTVGLQPAEWSEEDEKTIKEAIRRIEQLDHYWNRPTDEKLMNRLKSLSPQPHWKPSEEQINMLGAIVEREKEKPLYGIDGYSPAAVLESLYNDLKNSFRI